MSRSTSSSPLRKRPRLSSPTYDAYFDDLDSDDFQALDDIEARLSQETEKSVPPHHSEVSTRKKGCAVEHDFEERGDSRIMVVDENNTRRLESAHSQHRNPSSPTIGFTSAASLPLAGEPAPNHSTSNFASDFMSAASLAVPSPDISPDLLVQLPSHEDPSEPDLDSWFASSKEPLLAGFASASALKRDATAAGVVSPISFDRASGGKWAPPSAKALEAAKAKLQVWDAEIESELSILNHKADIGEDKQPKPDKETLKGLTNSNPHTSIPPASGFSPTKASSEAHHNAPRPFKAPAFTTPLRNRPMNSMQAPRPLLSNPILARSSAAASISIPRSPLKGSSFSTPSTPLHSSTPPRAQFSTPEQSRKLTPTRSTLSSQLPEATPRKAKPLGLTPRAHAFTGSARRPKFVTPFKQAAVLGEQERDSSLRAPQFIPQSPQYTGKGKAKEVGILPEKAEGSGLKKDTLNLRKPPVRATLAGCGLTPKTWTSDELADMGLDAELINLTAVSHFLYYRFDPAGADVSTSSLLPTQITLGADSALSALLESGCHLATKAWVDNHWSLILWKLIGMFCLDPFIHATKWTWTEVMRQLRYRYTRELENGVRPALRLITTHDAPPSGPLVLCISDVFWTAEYVDPDGQLVPAHPELELTDGWYRLRATVDETLARATRNKILRVGRKIECSGTRIESPKKEPMEVLDAYRTIHLLLSGNSTHLARWHTKLGFQPIPFVATLGSLSPDGGCVPLLDLLVTRVFPVGYIEYTTTESGEQIRDGPRNEKEEAQEEDRWKERRAHEAAKLQDELEKKLQLLESYADRLEHIAGNTFQPSDDESPPDIIDDLIEELEDAENPTLLIKSVDKKNAGWLAQSLRKKCEIDREKGGEDIDRELTASFPPRQVRNFRVLRVKDARTVRKPSIRTAQLTVWDVMSLHMTEGGSAGSFAVGQRYMVTNLIPTQPSAWMGLEPGSEVFLSTRRDSKWKVIR